MTEYGMIRVYTSEGARYEGKELAQSVVAYVHSLKIAARCVVLRGSGGCYENGELSSSHVVDLSYDLPVVIDIVLPLHESEAVLRKLETMVVDGLVCILPGRVTSFRSAGGLFPKHLLVADVMTPRPSIAHPDFSIRAVVELLLDTGLKALPVAEPDGRCVGILTQNDLVSRANMPLRLGLLHLLPAGEREDWLKSVEAVNCGSVMTPRPDTVLEGARLAEAIHLMNRERRKRLPVLDSRGVIVGMLSRIDILKALAATTSRPEALDLPPEVDHPRLVREVESRDAFTLREDVPIKAAIDALVREGLQRAAVLDDKGRLVGLITDEILLDALARHVPGRLPFGLFRRARLHDRPVSSIMRRELRTVTEDATIDEAIRLMTEYGLKRIPVIDASGAYRGMLRRDSILLTLAHAY